MEEVKRMLEWMREGKGYPLRMEIAPTLVCNMNCLFCWRYGRKVEIGEELSFEDYKRIIKEAAELNVKEVRVIGGGEPLFRKDTVDIMELIKKMGMFGYICTNGTLITQRLAERMVEMGWDHVKVSLHAPDATTEDYLTGLKGSFELAKRGVENLIKMRRKKGKRKPKVEIGLVLVKENYRKIMEMVKFVGEMGVDAFFIEPITVYSEVGERMKLGEEEEKEFVSIAKKAYELCNMLGIETNLNSFFSPRLVESTGRMLDVLKENKEEDIKLPPCFKPWLEIGIRNDGTVCPCGFYDVSSTENIKQKSLKQIWFGDYFERIRKNFLRGILPPHCQKCCATLVEENRRIRENLRKELERLKT